MRAFTVSEVLLLVALALLIGGCATAPAPRQTCEQFDAARKTTNYATEYQRDDKQVVKPLQRGPSAMALQYRLRLEADRVAPCSHVTIQKELTLARREVAAAVLTETREFFSEDGTRIALKHENLTSQLRQSGRYRASVPLPIPKTAPAGAYYLVSTLTLKTKDAADQVIAKTMVSFEVIASAPASAGTGASPSATKKK